MVGGRRTYGKDRKREEPEEAPPPSTLSLLHCWQSLQGGCKGAVALRAILLGKTDSLPSEEFWSRLEPTISSPASFSRLFSSHIQMAVLLPSSSSPPPSCYGA